MTKNKSNFLTELEMNKKFIFFVDKILPILFVSTFLAFIWCRYPIQFETNDDAGILQLLAGFRTGSPQPDSMFCMFLWGKLISSLYGINQNIPWYTLACMFFIALSLLVILFCFIKNTTSLREKIFLYSLYFFTILSVCLYSIVRLQFTTTAGICGAAVICIILTANDQEDHFRFLTDIVILSILFLVMLNLRKRVGYICIAICLSLCLYRVIKQDLTYKKVILFVFMILTLSFISYTSDRYHNEVSGIAKMKDYHHARSIFTDYAKISYEDGKSVYDSVGWDNTLYKAAAAWFFMDPHVNLDAFQSINTMAAQRISYTDRIRNGLGSIIHSPPILMRLFIAGLWALEMFLIMIHYRKDKKLLLETIAAFGFSAGIILICLYLALKGRLPDRGANMVSILCMIPCSIQSFKVIKLTKVYKISDNLKTYKIISTVSILLLLLTIGAGIYLFYDRDDVSEGIVSRKKVEAYCMDHMDNLYIYDLSLAYATDPFQVYPNEKPTNLLFWGGASAFWPMYYKQLELNGYTEMYSDQFFNENVFILGKTNPSEVLIEYMEKHFPGCECKIVNVFEDFVVYRFNMP